MCEIYMKRTKIFIEKYKIFEWDIVLEIFFKNLKMSMLPRWSYSQNTVLPKIIVSVWGWRGLTE